MPDKPIPPATQTVSETITAILSTKTYGEAAALLGIGRSALYERMDRHPDIRKALETIPQKALDVLRHGSVRAAEVFVEQLENRNNNMEAAKEVLDRVGVGVKTSNIAVQVNNNLNSLEFTVDDSQAA